MFRGIPHLLDVFRSPMRVGTILVLLGFLTTPIVVAAQEQACSDCIVYAGMDLNLRQDPIQSSEVLRTIPAGAELVVTSGEEIDGYMPVTYDSVPGWGASEGIASPSKSVGGTSDTPSSTVVDETPATTVVDESQRATLAPLTLRSGPAMDAEP